MTSRFRLIIRYIGIKKLIKPKGKIKVNHMKICELGCKTSQIMKQLHRYYPMGDQLPMRRKFTWLKSIRIVVSNRAILSSCSLY